MTFSVGSVVTLNKCVVSERSTNPQFGNWGFDRRDFCNRFFHQLESPLSATILPVCCPKKTQVSRGFASSPLAIFDNSVAVLNVLQKGWC